jgi:hypothetical protein
LALEAGTRTRRRRRIQRHDKQIEGGPVSGGYVAVSGAPPGDRQRKPPAAVLALAAPAAAHSADLGACSPDVGLLGFSDALDKTTFQGTSVGGLSALSLTDHGAKALVDNQGTTQARYYDLALRNGVPQVTGVTPLTQPDGTPFTGQDFDGEGLVALEDGSVLASSETEPAIRRFSRAGR